MNRWMKRALPALVICTAAAATFAQGLTREAPKDVKPAVIGVSATPPIITLNGQPDRLSPGARIRDLNNMLVMSGALANQRHYTVYKRDSAGLVHEVWLLTAEEYEKVGGLDVGDPNGFRRFVDLLNVIFALRGAKAAK
jgi:hypothetical protein